MLLFLKEFVSSERLSANPSMRPNLPGTKSKSRSMKNIFKVGKRSVTPR